ncbi:MAG TPA: hypothetical protein VF939_20960 [Puia sp.]
MKNIFVIIASALTLTACASITNSKLQPVSVSAAYKGETIEGAQCTLVNDKGTWFVNTSGSVTIQKSYGDLAVTCKKKKLPTGIASVSSGSNGGVWGNVLAGGLIGYAVDASSGAGFDYPTNINVIMGKTVALTPPKPPQPTSNKKQGDFDNLNN